VRNGHRKGAEKHLRRLADNNPGSGQIKVLKLAEKQYSDIRMLTGEEGYQEKMIGVNWHVML
jgi:CRISPR-associated endonuclease Cas2